MKKRFTLVELLGVIALIAILSVLGYTGYSYAMNSSKESATKALFARITSAMETCRTKNNFVPPSDGFQKITMDLAGNNPSITILNAVSGDNGIYLKSDSSHKFRQEFYNTFVKAMESDSLGRFLNNDNELCDGWGNPVYFRYPGKFNKGGFDLISGGEDGKFGSGNASSPETAIGKYRDSSGEWVVDDVGNF